MASRRAIGHWLILLLLSVLFSSLLLRIHLPAALLLGPLIAGLILSLRGVKLSIPRPCYLAAQAIVGCMIARAINPSVFGVLFNNWALVLAILLTTLAISGLTGWLLVRYSALPGATGAWGSSPGGASAMVVMAQEYGADVRLVALMQYLRVLFVVGAAALVVRYALGNEAQEMTQDIVWFPSLTLNFPFTLLLTAVACWLGMRLRIPSGAMLLPMLLGALAQGGGWLMLELPEWLLAMAYAVLGWTVGLQFNKAIFLLALKTLPQIIASIIGLILMCALMGPCPDPHSADGLYDRLSGHQPRRPGHGGDYRRRHPGGHVVYYGATDAAAVYHFADRPGDGAGYLPLCAAAIKSPRRARAGQIECPRARCARAICYQAFRAASAAS
ncbi:protein AbrB [Klebsiella pneumoniae]|uniref:Protein AbrB n=29 Tax=Bacteria TaxID=2 RepID=A0A378F1F4_KLEPN|nr:protein AbrB [Klebsiella pneumoniae]